MPRETHNLELSTRHQLLDLNRDNTKDDELAKL